jgi:hypothetical protein
MYMHIHLTEGTSNVHILTIKPHLMIHEPSTTASRIEAAKLKPLVSQRDEERPHSAVPLGHGPCRVSIRYSIQSSKDTLLQFLEEMLFCRILSFSLIYCRRYGGQH